jgi:hypothetical protein
LSRRSRSLASFMLPSPAAAAASLPAAAAAAGVRAGTGSASLQSRPGEMACQLSIRQVHRQPWQHWQGGEQADTRTQKKKGSKTDRCTGERQAGRNAFRRAGTRTQRLGETEGKAGRQTLIGRQAGRTADRLRDTHARSKAGRQPGEER